MRGYRFFYLDFIRSIAVMMIIFFHYNVWTGRIVSADYVFLKYHIFIGTIGVSLFIIVSGASLMLSTKNNYEVFDFYKRRFISIFPLFYFTYIFFVLTYAVIFQISPFSERNPVSFILTIIGLDGLLSYRIPNYYLIGEWFLGCIIIIYLMFPFIKYLFTLNKHLYMLASFIIWLLIYKFYNLDMPIYSFPLFRIFEFIFGMYFVSFCTNNSSKSSIALIAVALSGMVIIYCCDQVSSIIVGHIILGIFVFIILASLSYLIGNFLPRRLIHFISSYSYTAFLLHHIILKWMITHFKDSINSVYLNLALFFLTVISIFLISYIIQNLFRYTIRIPSYVKAN